MTTLPKINRRAWLATWAQQRRRRRLAVPTPVGDSELLAGLLGYWNLDEVAGDAVDATGLTGAFTSVGAGTVVGGGTHGQNARQTADDPAAYFTMGDQAAFHALPLTLNLWFNMTPEPASDWYPLWSKDDYLLPDRGIFCAVGTGGGGVIQGYVLDGNLGYPVANEETNLAPLVPGQWYMLTMVIEAAGFTLYLDAEFYTALACAPDLSSLNSFQLAARRKDSEATTDGGLPALLENFGLWNAALTPVQIAQLYNGGLGLNYYEL